jgi:uncharacterized protein
MGMERRIPTIPARPRDVGLFVLIVLVLGWIAADPAATYGLAFEGAVPTVVVVVTLLPIFALSPLIATAIVVRRGRLAGGLRTFLRERFRCRTDRRWYLVSLGLMPALAAVTVVGYTIFDRPIAVDPAFAGLVLLEVLAVGILFNLVENYGWRGFLQEALQARTSALVATLAVGVVWGLWHGVLLLPGGNFEAIPAHTFMVVVGGEAVVIGWVYNATGGSVLHAALMHTSFNASFGVLVFSMIQAGQSIDGFYAAIAVVIWLAAAVIVYRTGPSTLRSRGPSTA